MLQAAYAQRPEVRGEFGWWQALLSGVSGDLPVEGEGDRSLGASRELRWQLDRAATRRLLDAAPRAYRMGVDEVLLSALAQVLGEWTGRDAVLVELEGHGREDVLETADLTRTVGWFTTRYPVVLPCQADASSSLKAVKERLRSVPAKGLRWGLLEYGSDADIRVAIRALPRAQVSFNYLGQFDQVLDANGRFAFAPETGGEVMAGSAVLSHVLDLNAILLDGELSMSWRYSPGTLSEATVSRLVTAFHDRLTLLVGHCATAELSSTPSDFGLARLNQADLDGLDLSGPGVQDVYPATAMQQGLLFHSLLQASTGIYVYQLRLTLRGGLDRAALQAAWEAALGRHDILRTRFAWRHGDETLQVVQRHVVLPYAEQDLSGGTIREYDQHLSTWQAADVGRSFDLAEAPLMRVNLFTRPDGDHDLVWTSHHVLRTAGAHRRFLARSWQITACVSLEANSRRSPLPPIVPTFRGY